MIQTAVYGIFERKPQVDAAAERIVDLNLPVTITGIDPRSANNPKFWQKIDTSTDSFLLLWMTIGAIVGSAIGVLAIHTGDGNMVPALALLSGVCGTAIGAFIGILTGGIMEFEVTQVETRSRKGRVGAFLLVTHVHSNQERSQVEEIMDEAGAVEMRTKREELLYD